MDDGGRGRGKDDIFTLPPHPSPHSWPSTAPSVKYCSLFIASGGGGEVSGILVVSRSKLFLIPQQPGAS